MFNFALPNIFCDLFTTITIAIKYIMTENKKPNNAPHKGPKNVKKATKIFWGIVLFPPTLIIILIILISVGLFGKLPTFEELENPRSNIATDLITSDGENIGSFFVENRTFVEYGELSPNILAALVATEDARFYSHSGIDFLGLARVGVRSVLMGDRSQGGGSTISQQLAKNLYPRDTVNSSGLAKTGKLVIAKLKEWITATMLEYNYTKEEILVMYLNTVEYGSNAFGIKSAAQTFFNKLPSELTIEEAAMLVGVVNAPTRYSPVRNPKNAINRRNRVIERMASAEYITKQESERLQAKPIELDYHPISHNDGTGTYFREMLRLYMTATEPQREDYTSAWDYQVDANRWKNDQLYGWCSKNTKADGTQYNLYKDGLKIYVTLNAKMQRYAEESMTEQLSEVVQPQFDRQRKTYNSIYYGIPDEKKNTLINNAIKQSDRGRAMRRDGKTMDEIIATFNRPVDMTLFSYRGEIDTVMTPRDSVIYCKSILRSGFVAMDPMSGSVLAYVGGPSFRHFKYDMARRGRRQVGSTIKPFIYTFAIDYLGYTPCTMVPNSPVSIELGNGDIWHPGEAGKVAQDGELRPLKWGLANSRNNYSAWIMKQSSPQAVVDLIHKMGISSYIDPVYSVCLGTPEVSVFEMVGGFSTFVNRGVHTDPLIVTRIEDKQGNTLASFSGTTQDAISEQTAYTMLGMLKNNISAGTGGRLRYTYKMGEDVGGKTGTSNDQKDAWFVGVTPKVVGGAWVGGEDPNTYLLGRADGSAISLPIFGKFMTKVYNDKSLGITKEDKFMPPIGAVNFDCDEQPAGGSSAESTTRKRYEEEFFD